jgi:hypothetical protein
MLGLKNWKNLAMVCVLLECHVNSSYSRKYCIPDLKFYEDIPVTMIGRDRVSISDAISSILRLIDPQFPGVPYENLIKTLYRCELCNNVMVPHWADQHKCEPIVTTSLGEGSSQHVAGWLSDGSSDSVQIIRHVKPKLEGRLTGGTGRPLEIVRKRKKRQMHSDSDVEILN